MCVSWASEIHPGQFGGSCGCGGHISWKEEEEEEELGDGVQVRGKVAGMEGEQVI